MAGTICYYLSKYANRFLDFLDDKFYKLSSRPERPTGEMATGIHEESEKGNRRALATTWVNRNKI